MATLVTRVFGCIRSWMAAQADPSTQRDLGLQTRASLREGIHATLGEFGALLKARRWEWRKLESVG